MVWVGYREKGCRVVTEVAAEEAATLPMLLSGPVSGRQFELYCMDSLRASGWDVHDTPATGDQGVDVIAEKNGFRVAIQCKWLSTNARVGNAAVQEVRSGQDYERASHACVVSNVAYTQAAHALATATGVHLLHYDDLARLEKALTVHSDV